MLENLLFQETNDIVAILILDFLHFIIYYVIIANHINFQMLKMKTIFSLDLKSFILLNSLQKHIILF